MNILGLTQASAAQKYYRVTAPLRSLRQLGHTTTWGLSVTWTPNNWRHDVVAANWLGGPMSVVWLKRFQRAGSAVTVDFDNNVWRPHGYVQSPFLQGPWLNPLEVEVMRDQVALADLVTVTTEPLAEAVRKECATAEVVVIENAVPDWLLAHQRPMEDRLTIGWAGGSSHPGDWGVFREEVGRCLERHPDIQIQFRGARHMAGYRPSQVRTAPWNPNLEEHLRCLNFDIALAPLQRNAWNDSKSHIRCLEAAAVGIPVVASDEPPYRAFVVDGETGFLVREPGDASKYLDALIQDDQLRADMGAAARERAKAFTSSKTAPLWEAAYSKALGNIGRAA